MKSNKNKIEEDKFDKQSNDNKIQYMSSTLNPTIKTNKFKVTNEKATNNNTNNQIQNYNGINNIDKTKNNQLVKKLYYF